MKFRSTLLVLLISFAPAAFAEKTSYPATYAGGSLHLKHNKVRAALENDAVVFTQGSQRIAVPVKDIKEIAYGTDVRRRSEEHYIGVSWAGGTAQVLLRLSRAESTEFLAALERYTGITAVNTDQVPTVVRYQS